MLSKPTTIEQIDAWRAAKSESENLEFKEAKNQFDFHTLLSYCVALANERGGVLLLGIANRPPRPVVGTRAYLNVVKTTEDLFNKLHFRVDVEEVQHPGGRVLVLHIPPRPIGHPYELDGSYLMRSGESLVAMTPDQIKQIIAEGDFNPHETDGRLAIITAFVVLILAAAGAGTWFKYRALTDKPKQREVGLSPGRTETHPTSGNPTAVVGHPEQKSNTETNDTPGKKSPSSPSTKQRSDSTNQSLEASSRAWIAPDIAYFTSDIAKGAPLSFVVQYRNTGKSPAFDVHPIYKLEQVPVSKFDDNTFNALVEATDLCKDLSPAPGADVVYPNMPNPSNLIFTTHVPNWVGDDVVEGRSAIVLRMCFAYETMQKTHHTSFCFFYRTGVSQPNKQMNICTAGNHAD